MQIFFLNHRLSNLFIRFNSELIYGMKLSLDQFHTNGLKIEAE